VAAPQDHFAGLFGPKEAITIMKAREIEAWADYLGRELERLHGMPKQQAHRGATRWLRSIKKSTHPAPGRVTTKQSVVKAAYLPQRDSHA